MKSISAFGLLLYVTVSSHAIASCGSASCPLNMHHYLGAGWLHVMLSHEYIDQNRIYTGSSLSFVGALPNAHDEVQTINQRTLLGIQFGISEPLSFNVEIPFIQRQHTHRENGETESFSFTGFGDVVASGQFTLLLPAEEYDPYLSVQVGAKLPTGVTNASNVQGETAEVTIQPGTGSLDGLVALHFRQNLTSVPTLEREFSILPLTAGVSLQVNGKGTNDYRIGNTLLVYVGSQYQLTQRFHLLLQTNGMFRGYGDMGSTDELRENTGGTWIFVSPGLAFEIADGLSVSGYAQLPVYINVHGIQQSSAVNLQFSISADMDLFH